MSNSYSSPTSDEQDEFPKVTQADLDRATFRVGLKPAPRKRRVTILLDTGRVEGDDLEERSRRIFREEMQREGAAAGT